MLYFFFNFKDLYSQTLHCKRYPKVTQVSAFSACTTASTKKKVIPAENAVEVLLFWAAHTMATTA